MKVRRVAEPYAVSALMRREAASTAPKQVGPGDSANCPGAVTQEVLSPMHEQSSPEKSEEFARLDGAILGLLVSERRHPWTIDEIDREVGSESINVPPRIHQLEADGALHSWDEFVCATHALIRWHEIAEPDDPGSAFERKWERRILLLLLSGASNGLSEAEIMRELGAQSNGNKLAVTDALARLDGAGLVDRGDLLVVVSTAAARFDQLISL